MFILEELPYVVSSASCVETHVWRAGFSAQTSHRVMIVPQGCPRYLPRVIIREQANI